jgi:hypothetical protein
MRVKKQYVARGGKISFSGGGGEINIVFGQKYRLLVLLQWSKMIQKHIVSLLVCIENRHVFDVRIVLLLLCTGNKHGLV